MNNNIEIYNYNNYELNIKSDVLIDLKYLRVLIDIFIFDYKNIKIKTNNDNDIDTFMNNIKVRIKSFQNHKKIIDDYSKRINNNNLNDIIKNYNYNKKYVMIREVNEKSLIYTINNKGDLIHLYKLNTYDDYYIGLDEKDNNRDNIKEIDKEKFKIKIFSILYEIILNKDTFNHNKLICMFFFILNENDLIYYNLFCDIFNNFIDFIDNLGLNFKNITINNIICNGNIQIKKIIKSSKLFNKLINIFPSLETDINKFIVKDNIQSEYKNLNFGLILPYIDDLWMYNNWKMNPIINIHNNKFYHTFNGDCLLNPIFNTIFTNTTIINNIYNYFINNKQDYYTLSSMKDLIINNDNLNKYILSLFYILLFESYKINLNDGILLEKLSLYYDKNSIENINKIYNLIFSLFKIKCNYISQYESYNGDKFNLQDNVESMLIIIKLNDIENDIFDNKIICCITIDNIKYIYDSNNSLTKYNWLNINDIIVVYFNINDYKNYNDYYLIDDIIYGSIIKKY